MIRREGETCSGEPASIDANLIVFGWDCVFAAECAVTRGAWKGRPRSEHMVLI